MALGLDLTGRAKSLPFGKGVNNVAKVLGKVGIGAGLGLGMMTFWQGFDELTSIKVPSNVKILTTGAVAYQTNGYLGVIGYLLGSGIYRNLLPGLVGKTKNTAPVNQVY